LSHRCVIGLGSNLGDRLATLRAAAVAIREVAPVEVASPVYASAPVGGPPQGEYLNAAVLVSFGGAPSDLMAALLDIERAQGRVRGERWGPRTLDLDLLWIEDLVLESAALVVPHPHLRERAFAVRPLLDVLPDARDPRTGKAYSIPYGDVRVVAGARLL
jgi:2-amino-4-hydroxy-6-hydroxymethyldihydropteridine diphosphokinase